MTGGPGQGPGWRQPRRRHRPAGGGGTADRVLLDVPIENRRTQFDIERDRPATLVIVPESRHDEPQVLAVRGEDYEGVAQPLVTVGRRLDAAGGTAAEAGHRA